MYIALSLQVTDSVTTNLVERGRLGSNFSTQHNCKFLCSTFSLYIVTALHYRGGTRDIA